MIDNIVTPNQSILRLNINEKTKILAHDGLVLRLCAVHGKYEFDKIIKDFIKNDKIYIGSSAGSIILGNTIKYALGYDENNVDMTDFTGLEIINGIIIPHSSKKKEFVNLNNSSGRMIINPFNDFTPNKNATPFKISNANLDKMFFSNINSKKKE